MARKSSSATLKLEQEMREYRLAYLSVLSSTSEDMTSREELTLALQYAGRNPSWKTIGKYWKPSTKSLSYSEFCDMMKREKQNTKNDLMAAFKMIDVNNDGFISFAELTKALSMHGERMSESEVLSILEDADDNGDGRLHYDEFCDMMLSTAQQCKELNQKHLKDEDRTTKTSFLRKTSSMEVQRKNMKSLKVPRNLNQWSMEARKGFIVAESNGNYSAHSYLLDVPSTTQAWFTIQGNVQDEQRAVDFSLFIVKRDTQELVNFTRGVVSEKSCVQTELVAGEYNVFAFTTGCNLSTRKYETKKAVELIKTVGENIDLTKRCRDILTEIFHNCDLDGDGYLNRNEFDIFQMRTSGESCDDDSWDVMVENFETKNKRQITLKGFLDLNLMEARDAEGDANDLWVTFNSMGYSKSLQPDQVAFFVIEVFTGDCETSFEAEKVEQFETRLEQIVVQSVVENSTTRNIKRMRDLILHHYEDDTRVTLAVENKSRQQVRVRLNCKRSENCSSHRGNLNHVIKVEPRSTEIGHHLVPVHPSKAWSVTCDDSVES